MLHLDRAYSMVMHSGLISVFFRTNTNTCINTRFSLELSTEPSNSCISVVKSNYSEHFCFK